MKRRPKELSEDADMQLQKPAALKWSSESYAIPISRADWRFLLPDPNPKKTLCLTGGAIAETAQLFSDNISYPESGSGNSDFDLAVLNNTDDERLRYAASVLKPGAACYAEWDVNALFTPSRLINKLKDAGFISVELYMPKPNPDTAVPGIWIPIESHGAVSYLLNSTYRSQSMLRRAVKMAYRALWFLIPGLFHKFPWLISSGNGRFKVCTIACKPGPRVTGTEMSKYKDGLMEITRLLPDKNSNFHPSKLRTMIISGGLNRLNKIVLLVFREGSQTPMYIIKIPRTARSNSALKNEANTLCGLMQNYNMKDQIPQVLYDDSRLGFFSIGETYIEGRFLGDFRDRRQLSGIAGKLTNWLIDLAGKTSAPLPEDWRSSYINPLIEVLERTVTDSLDLKLVYEALDILDGFEIPAFVCEHRDFAPWNILVTANQQFGVLDWESSRFDGLPGLDLIYFLTYLCLYIEDAWTSEKALECYKNMLDSDTKLGKLYRDCFNLYANRLALTPETHRPLRIMTWIAHLVSVNERIKEGDEFSSGVDYVSQRLFLQLIKFELMSSRNS